MKKGFILADILGSDLTAEDLEVLRHPALWGVLLFSRNYQSPQQLQILVQRIYQQNNRLLVAVDQEGGRVQRFVQGFTKLQSMRHWGELFATDQKTAVKSLCAQTAVMVNELQAVGVRASLAPVLDLDYGGSEIIGERSFHADPDVVIHLAGAVIDVMHSYNMPVLGKHFPGHGAVRLDSHKDFPVDTRAWEEIWEKDMLPYRQLGQRLDSVMTAHVTYEAVDTLPATFSGRWLQEVLRKRMQYSGVVMTDDLSMIGASKIGDYEDRARCALEAGCDILTVCNNRLGLFQILDSLGNYSNSASADRIGKYLGRF